MQHWIVRVDTRLNTTQPHRLLLCLALSLFLSLPAFASEADPPPEAPDEPAEASGEDEASPTALDDVIVYARKRGEPSQRVPIALDVLDSSALFERGIYDLDDVTRQSPSLHLEQGSVPQDLKLSVRGITPTRGRPNMAILLDGVDITTEAMITSGGSLLIDPMLFDIEQIEIIKGPQNALYGRSAFAGAINYKTRGPGDDFAAAVETDLGDYGQRMVRGRISGPIVRDTLSAGFSFSSWNHDGFYRSPITGGDLGGRSGNSFAGTIRWTPGGGWTIRSRVSYEDSELGIAPQVHPEPNAVFPLPASALGPVVDPGVTSIRGIQGMPPDWDESQIGNSSNPRTPGRDYPGSDKEVLRGTLSITRRFGDGRGAGPARFVSLTHVARGDSLQYQDFNNYGDAADLPAFGEIWIDNDTDLFSQDIRLQSGTGGTFDWTIGAEYWEESRDVLNGGVTCLTYAPPFVPAETAPPCAPLVAPIGTTLPRNPDLWTRDIEHLSAYGIVTWHINERWNASFEGRYVDEELTAGGPDLDNSIVSPLPFLGGASFPAPASLVTATESDSYFTPRASIQYLPNERMTGYFSIAQGIKPAGISSVNGGGGTFFPEQLRFEQEKVIVYELGSKMDLLDRRMRLNTALFFQDFTDKQVTSQIVDENGFLQSRIRNADAEIYGAEIDLTWYPIDALRLQAGYTYLESEYTGFTQLTRSPGVVAYTGGCELVTTSAGQSTCRVDFNGKEVERVPKHSLVGIARYSSAVTSRFNWFVDLQTSFRDERFSNPNNLLKFDSYWLSELRVGLSGDDWQVVAYVDNLFDDDTIRHGFNTGGDLRNFSIEGATFVLPDSAQYYLPSPRTFGIRAAYRFGR
jgi:outer membrane receptor protein involved in Fe transport